MTGIRSTDRTLAVAGAFELADAGALHAANAPETVAVDYAYYNPVSLLLKKKGWLERKKSP